MQTEAHSSPKERPDQVSRRMPATRDILFAVVSLLVIPWALWGSRTVVPDIGHVAGSSLRSGFVACVLLYLCSVVMKSWPPRRLHYVAIVLLFHIVMGGAVFFRSLSSDNHSCNGSNAACFNQAPS